MRKWILIIVTQLVVFYSVSAQDQVGCLQLLEDAKEAYEAGMVELVPELLLPCIESGLSGDPKLEAYKLVITAYLFDYLPEPADALMSDFLDEYPNYHVAAADPSEFRILLATHQQQRDEEQAARIQAEKVAKQEADRAAKQEADRAAKEKPKETERRTVARSTMQQGAGAGFIVGTNLSFPSLIEPYSLSDPTVNTGTYKKATPGFHLGGAAAFELSKGIHAAFEVMYQRCRVNYSAAPFTFTSYEYEEVQNRFALPVSLLFTVNPDSRSQVYFRFGVMADYMISAGASAVRSFDTSQPDVVLERTDITSSRRRLNWYGLAGVGVKVPFESNYLFIESRFQYALQKSNNESERYSNQDLTWLIYHVDNDFKLSQLSISAGMIFYLR
ncbi:MAG: outer membrane beta-barrel protein [Bacteroidetes bacterium]|nr:outer membrane beta-barrel protein [Bacteroidota bacterium]